MKTVFRLVLLAALAAGGFWLWTVLFPSPEKVVRRQIARLAATATFKADANNLTRAGKAMKLVSFFAPDGQITFDASGYPGRTLSGRDEIKETALAGFAGLPQLKVEFLDVTIHLGADRQTADVSCTARVDIGDRKDYGVQEMRFQLKKTDGKWLITLAATVKTLS
jgi:hypothetical protein